MGEEKKEKNNDWAAICPECSKRHLLVFTPKDKKSLNSEFLLLICRNCGFEDTTDYDTFCEIYNEDGMEEKCKNCKHENELKFKKYNYEDESICEQCTFNQYLENEFVPK